MPRPDTRQEKRDEHLPTVAAAFAELGYRRTTTAELSRRCGLPENVLYRLWPDKRAMFLAAIDHVFDHSLGLWTRLLEADGDESGAERLLTYESRHHGEQRLYRIVFAGLSETDDPEVRAALRRMYRHFHDFIATEVRQHRGPDADGAPDADLTAWAIVALGTVANIGRDLGLISATDRQRLLLDLGGALMTPRNTR